MIQLDPIIAVNDVKSTSKWYQSVFGLRNIHGGNEFDVLVDDHDNILLCLHAWGEHGHPTMQNLDGDIGNGLILYFRTKDLQQTRERLRDLKYGVEREIEWNPNALRHEFSFRDPNGYYVTVSEFHEYRG